MAEIRLAPVERRPVWAEIRLYGQIEYDPAHQSVVTAYMPGVVNRVYIERAGVTVRWGQPLFDFYSSDLYFTEQELFEAAQVVPGLLDFRHAVPHTARKGEVQTRREAASRQETPAREEGDAKEAALQKMAAIRHKLRLLGLGKKDIDELMQRGEPTGIATVTAPRAGVVIRKEALEGTYVNTGTPLFTIADPRYVWLKLDAYESDLAWIRSGQEVEFQSDAVAGERFKGKVVFVDPIFNPRTRTTTVGVIAPEGEGRLRPQMIIRAVIRAEVGSEGRVLGEGGRRDRPPLVVPASAPLITGRRAVVYVLVPGEERVFEGREVVLGPRAKDHYVVREGLEEGEQVVVNGNFKIDSAAQILAKPSMMAPQDKVGGTGK
jgi:Cu(I)/Ag(I) efflux system membrane fusion protein